MNRTSRRGRGAWLMVLSVLASIALIAAACGDDDDAEAPSDAVSQETPAAPAPSDDDSGSEEPAVVDQDRSINVAIVGNPQMEDIASLTPDLFTASTGIAVNYTFLEEQTLREIVTRDVGAGGEQFDVVMIGMFEAPQFGANGWLYDLNEFASRTPEWNVDDIIPAVSRRALVRGQPVRRAVLRRVFLRHVPPGRHRRGRVDHARRTHLGRAGRDRPFRGFRRDGGHLPPGQAGLG